jgi:hypothetical protein
VRGNLPFCGYGEVRLVPSIEDKEMAKNKTPERVDDTARPESGSMEAPASDVVEIAKRNGEFMRWGKLIGAYLYLRSLNAARPRSIWWKGLIGLGTVGGLVIKYALPVFAG